MIDDDDRDSVNYPIDDGVQKSKKRKLFYNIGIYIIAIVCILALFKFVIYPMTTSSGEPYQVDGVIYALTFEPSHFVGVAGKGGHTVSDKWFIHIASYNSRTNEDKLLKWDVSKEIFDSHEIGETIKVTVQ